MFLPLYSHVMDWVFPSKLSYRIESLRIWEHLMYVLRGITVVTMGYSIDSLDVCFGDQLAGSSHEPMHRGWHTFSSWLSGRYVGLWYVSKVSIIFDCSMLYYILFWTLLGFIIHFYIIFGTNLLTKGPVQIAVFLPISVFRRKGISNGVQTEWNLRESYFWNGSNPGDLE